MNLGELVQEIGLIVQDPSLERFFERWVNQAILALATDFDLPALKLIRPATFNVSTADWVFDAPDNFLKGLFKCRDSAGNKVHICNSIDKLDDLDPDHTEIGDHITDIAVMEHGTGKKFCVYPKANETAQVWFFERPAVLVKAGDIPTCIPEGFHHRVIIPKVVLNNFRLLQDMATEAPHQSLAYWEEEYRKGLFGTPRGDNGLFSVIAKSLNPRRHGGRDPLP